MIQQKENFIELISEAEISNKVQSLASNISGRYQEEAPILIGILNGSFIFAADLIRALQIDCEIDFIKVSSYQGTKSQGYIKILKDITVKISNRHVVIIEDIIDSGLTIELIRNRMIKKAPKSIAIATLLLKPNIAKLDFDIDWVGFEIPPEFVVGYGLDYDQKFRNLRGIYRLGGKKE